MASTGDSVSLAQGFLLAKAAFLANAVEWTKLQTTHFRASCHYPLGALHACFSVHHCQVCSLVHMKNIKTGDEPGRA